MPTKKSEGHDTGPRSLMYGAAGPLLPGVCNLPVPARVLAAAAPDSEGGGDESSRRHDTDALLLMEDLGSGDAQGILVTVVPSRREQIMVPVDSMAVKGRCRSCRVD